MDGVGEWATTSAAIGRRGRWSFSRRSTSRIRWACCTPPFTYYTGFKVNSGEYKLMGLAPYGEPTLCEVIFDQLIDLKPDGSFRLDQQLLQLLPPA